MGDRRPGGDFWQSPYETYIERVGDCEDMAILNVAFFNHWGIRAYVMTVSTRPNGELDHAIAVVWMGGSPEEFINFLGDLVYYELENGYFMLVDNAYSDVFGFLQHGLGECEFHAKPFINGRFLFTLEEVVEMHRVIREAWIP